jgi:hypothetical protein
MQNNADDNLRLVYTALSNPDKVWWRTDGTLTPASLDNYGLLTQTVPGGAYAETRVPANNDVYNAENDPVFLYDLNLVPNRLYYYYVRTVRYVDVPGEGWRAIYSVWSSTAVTTSVIKPVENLRVEPNRSGANYDANYDPQTQILVGFDAPVSLAEWQGGAFVFRYELMDESGAWSVERDFTAADFRYVTQAAGVGLTGYTRFIMKISGLSPGTSYTLRVRIYDTANRDSSLWSNLVRFRTEMDQDDYDDQKHVNDWLEYLRKLLADLLKDPYWLARESETALTAAYRQTMFNNLLIAAPDGMIDLYTGAGGAREAVYYIPITSVRQAVAANKGIRIAFADGDVILSPGFINLGYNNSIKTMAEYMRTNDRGIMDYFVRITITSARPVGTVEGETPLGSTRTVQMTAVGANTSLGDWDDDLFAQFAELVADTVDDEDIREELTEMVHDKETSQEIIAYIETLIEGLRGEMMDIVRDDLRTSGILTSRHDTAFAQADSPMVVTLKSADASSSVVSGYYFAATGWTRQTVLDYGAAKAMRVSAMGTYVFTGRTLNVPGIGDTRQGGDITDLIARYGLDDYLGRDSINLNANATRYMVAGCISRMAGAPKTADPLTWLPANLSFVMSSRVSGGAVQNQ